MALTCQQCQQPLQLDASLVDLTPSAYDMIVGSLPPRPSSIAPPADQSEQLARLPTSPAMKAVWRTAAENGTTPARTTLSPRAQGKLPIRSTAGLPNESFVLLQDSAIHSLPSQSSPSRVGNTSMPSRLSLNGRTPDAIHVPDYPSSPLSHHLRSTQRLLNLLSSRTEIDHPLCSECTHTLLTTLSRQLDETKKERDGYIAFEKEVKREKERERDGLKKEEAEKRIRELDEEERVAIEQLRAAERERTQLEEELRALESEERVLEEEEDEFWRAHNAQLLKTSEQSSHLAALRAAYAADFATLERLERTNVYNDAFCIGHDGPFGTINNLRLGRVPGVPVEWAEVNAAWGQTLLLLYTIARKLDFTFEHYRLVPMGSFSRVERTTGDKATYELYGSGDLHLGRLLHNRRFDFAMVAFLECLKQIMDWAKSQDTNLEFPHQIAKDKIGESSIKLQFSQEEAWTRALRHVLLALKILLKWATNGSNG